jgi:hypothetical protein
MSFVDQTVAANTDIASSYIAGNTVENRQLKVIKLKVPSPSTSKAVWIGNFIIDYKLNFFILRI